MSPRDDYTKAARCPVCKLSPGLCICETLPRITLPVEFIVIRHGTEREWHSNTGTLVGHILENSRVLDYGVKGAPFDSADLHADEVNLHVLFPRPGAQVLTPESLESPAALVILDSTWPKARRIWKRVAELRDRPFFRLPPGPPPALTLRDPPDETRFFTLDAVARAVRALGYETEGQEIERVAREIVKRRLHLRGKFPRTEL